MNRQRKIRDIFAAPKQGATIPAVNSYLVSYPGGYVNFGSVRGLGPLGLQLIEQIRSKKYTRSSLMSQYQMLREIERVLVILAKQRGSLPITLVKDLSPDIITAALYEIARNSCRSKLTIYNYHVKISKLLYSAYSDEMRRVPTPQSPPVREPKVLADGEVSLLECSINECFERFAAKIQRASIVLANGGDDSDTSLRGDLTREWLSRTGGKPLSLNGLISSGHGDFLQRLENALISPWQLYAQLYPTSFDEVTCKLRLALLEGLNMQPLFDLEQNTLIEDTKCNSILQINKVRGSGHISTWPNRPDRSAETARTVEIYNLSRQPLIPYAPEEKRSRLWIAIRRYSKQNHLVTVRDYDAGAREWGFQLGGWSKQNGLPNGLMSALLTRMRKYVGKREFTELDESLQAASKRLSHRGPTPLTYGLAMCGPDERALLMNNYFQSFHERAMMPRKEFRL